MVPVEGKEQGRGEKGVEDAEIENAERGWGGAGD